jgi:uncharacterized protein DUF1189
VDRDPRGFTYVDAFWQSFFSPALYVDVARRWQGIGFLYLLLIVTISWLPDLVKVQGSLQAWNSEAAEGLIRQVPAIDISDGAASADVDTPYFIKDPKDGKVLAIIDFTGQYTNLENSSAIVLLTRKEVTLKHSSSETRTYSLSGAKHFAIDQTRVRHWVHLFVTWNMLLIAPLVIVFTYAFRMIQTLIYAAVGMAFANWFHAKLTYSALLRIACVALTPVVIFTMVTDLLPMFRTFPRPLVWLIHIAIALWYISFTVKAGAGEPADSPSTPSASAPLA